MGLFRYSIAIIAAIIISFPGIARADCIDPAGEAGELVFSTSTVSMEYCNGAEWIGFPKRTVAASCGVLDNWAAQSVAASTWDAVAYGAGRFVAVSQGSGAAMTSVDGINWDPIASVFGTDVAYGDGLFVVVTADHWQRRTFTSSDGVNWNTHNNALPAGGGRWHKVTYGNGHFVAVSWHAGGAHKSIISTDGINWTVNEIGDLAWWDVEYGNGMFVAVNYHEPDVAVSPDGINWTMHTEVAADFGRSRSIAYANGLFVIVARDGINRVMTSPDGVNWTVQTPAEINEWEAVVFGDGMFVAVASTGTNRVMISTDGIDWSPMAAAEANEWRGVAYGGGRFVAVANTGTNRVMTAECLSPGCEDPEAPAGGIVYSGNYRVMQWCDGANWQALGPINPPGPNDGCIDPVKPGGNMLFSRTYCVLQYCDGDAWRGIGRSDPCACDADAGIWTRHNSANGNDWRTVAYGAGMFVAPSWNGTDRIMTSPDGTAWTARPVALGTHAITFGNGIFVAIQAQSGVRNVITSPDGINWTTHANAMPTGGNWVSVVYGDNGFVAVDSNASSRVARSTDGITWTSHNVNAEVAGGRWTDIAYGNGRYVAVRGWDWDMAGPGIMSSPDGISWTGETETNGVYGVSITFGNGRFVGVGWTHLAFSSTDGENWIVGGTTGIAGGTSNVAYGEGIFVALAGYPQGMFRSPDGITWTSMSPPAGISGWFDGSALTYGNGTFVAVSGAEGTMRATCLGGG